MKRRTRTACLALILGPLSFLVRAQDATSPTEQQLQQTTPELTLQEAVALALQKNSSLRNAGLETQRASDDLAAARTRRYAKTEIIGLGAELVTKPSITFPAGSLGVYGATGPLPSTDRTIEIPRKP